ncbi:MAG: chromate efflux transporter [Candidatus Aenigmarchaeota archaeon]|nr:chromate efflux transporter [Candidatus Aenigmarchaeota archaeon]
MKEGKNAFSDQSYSGIFLRFLRFGFLAWGGPVAQIGMIKKDLVDEEKWISPQKFNRALAVYQALPGPEAHELCVYFGHLAKGRLGGLLAGLGFMLPGFVLMLILSWIYLTFGINSALFAGVFYGMQPAVAALIFRAVHSIGNSAVTNPLLFALFFISFLASLLGIHFIFALIFPATAYYFSRKKQYLLAAFSCLLILTVAFVYGSVSSFQLSQGTAAAPATPELFFTGLKGGLLSFGGAYTSIPFIEQDAVSKGWMTNSQFLDGLALGGIIPAPLIIFSTFVGYFAGGLGGALAMTIGIFLPAFAFTLAGHKYLEMLIISRKLKDFLDGLTAGVIGFIGAISVILWKEAVTDIATFAIFLLSMFILYRWHAKASVAFVMIGAGIAGLLLSGWI